MMPSLSASELMSPLMAVLPENPIFFHATAVDPDGFKNAIGQMSNVGFEMFIYSFGTPFTLEVQCCDCC